MSAQAQTFLFIDLVGFTALTIERGDDGAADVALRFYEHVRSTLEEHGAEEIKTIGDAMMVRCEDPRLAVRLGLRLVDQLDAAGLPPLRVGVHTGSAVCRSGDWYGAGVNVAARLCSAAGGGEVLVSETTRTAAGSLGQVELGERQLHWLKNVAEPVAARPAFGPVVIQQRRPVRSLLRRMRIGPTRARRRAPVCLKGTRVIG